jgi:lipopolysaccharide/colanic/teichoic acid biosynthesis glycosyltransferase
MASSSIIVRSAAPPSAASRLLVDSLRFQLGTGMLTAIALPSVIAIIVSGGTGASATNSIMGSSVALILGAYLLRRLSTFPGVRSFSYILPSFAASFGGTLVAFLLLRLDYSRAIFLLSFIASLGTFALICILSRRKALHIHVIPGGDVASLQQMPQVNWTVLREPRFPAARRPTFAVDLRSNLSDDWRRLISKAAVSGHPVYHFKDLRESLTGRVEIEHLSENKFGSLLPNLAYCKMKMAVDFVVAVTLLPFLALPLVVVALLIKLDSPGPALFRQVRMGFRGEPFVVFKFRTMRHSPLDEPQSDAREAAMTHDRDPRITNFGHFLRKSRIDELPQILNILRGEMSWIGPRPEAMPLSAWYERELPFYPYRHIVRPGITGWAQVNQGHVADIEQVHVKLHYDFYYIKYFSAWLDGLIVLRTLKVILWGIGAR